MENYIVRIYRRDKNAPCKLTGVVEDVRTEDKKAFRNLDELWEILNPPEGGDVQGGKDRVAGKRKYLKKGGNRSTLIGGDPR